MPLLKDKLPSPKIIPAFVTLVDLSDAYVAHWTPAVFQLILNFFIMPAVHLIFG